VVDARACTLSARSANGAVPNGCALKQRTTVDISFLSNLRHCRASKKVPAAALQSSTSKVKLGYISVGYITNDLWRYFLALHIVVLPLVRRILALQGGFIFPSTKVSTD
jgi:hypothetical protein